MKAKSNAAFELEREAMSSAERELLKRDLNRVIDEYFERDDGTGARRKFAPRPDHKEGFCRQYDQMKR